MNLVQSGLSQYIQDISHHDVLSAEDEQRLAIRYYEDQDVEAARALVMGNLRFALKIALEYSRYAPVMDLVQEANLGLMEAVRRFNPYRGYRLITYAVWWIRAHIQKFVVESSSVVRRGTTRDQRTIARKLTSTRMALQHESGEEASLGELADALDVSEEAVAAIMQKTDVSLDAPAGERDESSATLLDFLADQAISPEDALITQEQQSLIQAALEDVMENLDEREREILQMRLLSHEPATLQVIADQFDVSRERVRQIETGLRKKIGASYKAMLSRERSLPLPSGQNDRST